ncbi:MAG TPA: CsbD family protein, partial [Hyphomicrobium sp.]|nr:CsbD family protein [Hyphomicrobium sp.]
MSSTSDKIKGYANEAAGKVKQGVGRVVGSEKLEAEGLAQEAKGDAQKAVGRVKDAANEAYDTAAQSSTVDKVKGYANEAAGK